MRRLPALIVLCAGLALLAACGQVGDVCQTSGSTEGCAQDHICTFASTPETFDLDPNATPPAPLNVCLRQCEQSTDCGEGELCRTVFCSTQTSCQTGPLAEPPPNICGGDTGPDGGTDGGMDGGTDGGMDGGTPACDSEARAYIQTLDPGAGFNRTNFVPLDTTNLPDSWDRYSIELDLTDPLLEGQLLQFGFSATASNFEPSGVFYDNVVIDPDAEYEEDFEALDQTSPTALNPDPDPLWGAGWIVFGNAFQPDGETFVYGYGPNPAPNGGPGFSAIDMGQGGAEQGTQQLSIYSDYNNADQNTGLRIEANTFRERTIAAGDVGKTLIFRFDAKRGNINDGCPPP